MKTDAFTILQPLPCDECKAECCGAVPFTADQYQQAVAHIKSLADGEALRLSKQKRDEITCPFVDVSNYSCSIYPVRPRLCQMFGRVDHPRLTCPYAPERRMELPASYGSLVATLDALKADIFPTWKGILEDINL